VLQMCILNHLIVHIKIKGCINLGRMEQSRLRLIETVNFFDLGESFCAQFVGLNEEQLILFRV
jgi:hypothetical protein